MYLVVLRIVSRIKKCENIQGFSFKIPKLRSFPVKPEVLEKCQITKNGPLLVYITSAKFQYYNLKTQKTMTYLMISLTPGIQGVP